MSLSYLDYINIATTGGNSVADGFCTVESNSYVFIAPFTVQDVAGNWMVSYLGHVM